jgi:hypothetical protein
MLESMEIIGAAEPSTSATAARVISFFIVEVSSTDLSLIPEQFIDAHVDDVIPKRR